jgi:Ni/Co efflux regulator RcnB
VADDLIGRSSRYTFRQIRQIPAQGCDKRALSLSQTPLRRRNEKERTMKKFLMALAATSMIASPLIASQAQAAPYQQRGAQDYRSNGRTVVKQKTVVRHNDSRYGQNNYRNGQHHWAKGQRFDRQQARNYRVISNPRAYHLNAPPRGYQWVQSGNDAVMVALVSGIIGAVIGNAIR